jgi:SprT protein
LSKVLLKYIPEEAMPLIQQWYGQLPFHLRITKARKTKFGDFRPAFQGKPNRVSVNGDLNKYHFLITLTHEIAHVACWEQFKGRVNPHGIEWKSIYSDMLKQLMAKVTFPKDVATALKKHLKLPKASSCSDPDLYKVLKRYNGESELVFLDSILEGQEFDFQGRHFKRGKKRRTRIECIELKTNKVYLISGHAEVGKLTDV